MRKATVALAGITIAGFATAATFKTVFGTSPEGVVPKELVADIFERKDTAAELANIRMMVLKMDPTIEPLTAPGNELQLAMKLRDFVYKRVPVRSDWLDIDWRNLDKFVYQALNGDQSKGLICGGLSAVYSTILTSFNIQHRNVSLFSEVDPIGDNHASVEVRISKQWLVMDPTFNISLADSNGTLLSWKDVSERCQSGQTPIIQYGPETPAKGRSNINTYYTPICSLTKYLARSPANGKPFTTVPADWDGVIHTKDGAPFSVKVQLTESMPWKVLR